MDLIYSTIFYILFIFRQAHSNLEIFSFVIDSRSINYCFSQAMIRFPSGRIAKNEIMDVVNDLGSQSTSSNGENYLVQESAFAAAS